jgi:hypothetical protein
LASLLPLPLSLTVLPSTTPWSAPARATGAALPAEAVTVTRLVRLLALPSLTTKAAV